MFFSYLDELLETALNLIYIWSSWHFVHVLRKLLYSFALMMCIQQSSSWQLEAFEPSARFNASGTSVV